MTLTKWHADIEFRNEGFNPYKMTAIPTQCCLEIEMNDTDCSVSELATLD